MLKTLRVRNLAIIEDVTVDFGPGLNLLTGETGAGKSLLADALGLAAGARGDAALIRSGAERAVIEAEFELSGGGNAGCELARLGVEAEDGTVVVRRELAAAGSGRVRVNGSPATVSLLRTLSARLVELHGQHEQQNLLSSERHLELLDGYGGHVDELVAVARACEEVRSARGRLAELQQRARDREARGERLRALVREIDSVAPVPGELDEVERERRLVQHAAQIAGGVEQAAALLYTGEVTAASLSAKAAARLVELDGLDPQLDEIRARTDSARVELEDVGLALRDYLQRTDFDPARLESLENRRAALERLLLHHGPDEQAALDACAAARAELATLGKLEQEIGLAEVALAEAEQRYADRGRKLRECREQAAAAMSAAVRREFRALALGQARFEVGFRPARGEALSNGMVLGPRGGERAEFLLAVNPGEGPRPLARVASGGELSRVMLALHMLVDRGVGGPALVFDEVDAGVGGAVADAIGSRLGALACRRQVLCLTHLAQVAVYADHHYHVGKQVRAGRTYAEVVRLDAEGQVEELARMLGGKRVTVASRRHAAELLQAAAQPARSRPARRRV